MFTELVRLGRDSSVKQLDNGLSVANLACAYDVGFGDKKTTQWLDLAVFGKQAEALAPYFTKGRQFMITCKDVQVEEYNKKDGSMGASLKATAVEMKFAGDKSDSQTQPQQFGQAPQQNVAQQPVYNQATQPAQQQVYAQSDAPPQLTPPVPRFDPATGQQINNELPF